MVITDDWPAERMIAAEADGMLRPDRRDTAYGRKTAEAFAVAGGKHNPVWQAALAEVKPLLPASRADYSVKAVRHALATAIALRAAELLTMADREIWEHRRWPEGETLLAATCTVVGRIAPLVVDAWLEHLGYPHISLVARI